MKKMLTTLAAVLCYAAVFTSCNDDITPPGYKDLGGTWVADVSGNTFSIWNYGKAWNVWTFNADGTGVCNVFFLMGEEPVAIQRQPFTYTAEDGKLITQMDDCSREWTYRTEGGKLTTSYEGESEMSFDKADAVQTAQFDEWGKRELLSVPDLQDYADKLAANTGDAELTAIAADLRKAFDKAILQRADISWSVQHLDRYSLSVCLYKQTGWGDFLRINNGLPWGNPTSGGGGPIE